MTTEHKYHLKTGQSGEAQLKGLDKFFGKPSREFLDSIGISKGMRVLDVGCGIGSLSFWLAERVGPTGHVTAVDSDIAQIEVAREHSQAHGITNITFEQANAHDLSAYKNQFDLAYCRWLLVHVQNPATVVKSMADTLSPGGILACEVGDLTSTQYYPAFPKYIELRNKIALLLKNSGNDIDIGTHIFKICKQLQKFTFNAKLSQVVLYHPEATKAFTDNFSVLLDSVKTALLEAKLMTEQEINETRSALLNHPIDDDTLIFQSRMTQVWCQKQK